MSMSKKKMSDMESYPPVLRRLISETEDNPEEAPVLNRDKDIPIPVIDLECLDAELLRGACRDWGIFRLQNHGIPLTVTSRLQGISKALLSLPFETKQLMTSPVSYFWGTPALTPSGSALGRGTADVINLVEGFNVPLSHLRDDAHRQHQHPLLEPFRELMDEYGRHLSRVAETLFEAILRNLNLDIKRSEYLSEATGLVRVYRYPGISGEALGMEVHTDSSVLSILSQDQVGGLEFIKDGEWFHVQPLPNTLIVNLGDMMQAISNDEYRSVEHRVGMRKGRERQSICYFVFPEKDRVIESSRYKPFTYSQFQAQVQLDLHSLGSKVGLPRFLASPPS
ncbi:PREDICTED: gibberellin 2-beta-dioxygenase 8 [Tarenaya hassleriana]|uniref:gibberellin 2-beta-dioxygenase 8 n=1 Tax=Tarenaya hassleriana TaxID=28532 RepID=UPI00053C2882|nr:PREDICTED: gibberellin 2-beta-dioxygenase 8 [Tarenaya hassleriana]